MQKLLKFYALIIIINCVLYAQSGWIWQNPLPQGNNMSELQFVNSTTAYAMCFNSVMKSTNAGMNWSIYYTGHSQNNTSLYFINATTGFVVSDTGIVLKTVNGGVNWNILYDFHQKKFHKIYFNDVNTGYLLRYNDTYSYKGTVLYRTSNGGISWNILYNDSTISINDINFIDLQTGYLGGYLNNFSNSNNYAKVFKTTNSGNTLDSLNTNFNLKTKGIKPINLNNIYVFGDRGSPSSKGFFSTTNGGFSWLASDIFRDVYDFSYVDINNLYITATNSYFSLYRSSNYGINWININNFIDITYLEFINSSNALAVGSNGIISSTTNAGLNWVEHYTNVTNNIWGIDFVNANTGYISAQGNLLKTTNGGTNWINIFSHGLNHLDFIDANTGYFGGEDSLFKTTNGGVTITRLNFSNSPGILNEIQFLNANTGFIIGKYNITWKTTNGGDNWNILTGYGNGYHECLYFFNESLGFIGREDINLGWGVSRTTNGGINWDFQSFPSVNSFIFDFYFTNNNTGYFTTRNKIFKTTNAGNNWVTVYNYNNDYYPIEMLSIHFVNNDVGYAAITSGQILKTTNAGYTWKIYNSISNCAFYDLYFTDVNTGYFVGGGGVILKTTNGCGDPIGIQTLSNEIPKEFSLKQNYPNPFNPATTIEFDIPKTDANSQRVTLVIYDILGREVATPVNEALSPGKYSVSWNAENIPSGVYFYTLSNGLFSSTKKMILLK